METGKVYFLGAGPGDPELLTLKAYRLLQAGEVILHDGLIGTGVLDLANPAARQIHAGKRAAYTGEISDSQECIHRRMIREARAGKIVIRLQGGDPGVFGRLGEEMLALADAGIPFEVVPGVSSVVAAPDLTGIPLTHRSLSSSFMVITGHEDPTKAQSALDWQIITQHIEGGGTLVILMGVRRMEANMQHLLRHGADTGIPAVVIEKASTSREFTVSGTIHTIARQAKDAGVRSPAVVIVGPVVKIREQVKAAHSRKQPGQGSDYVRQALRTERATG